MTGLSHDKDFPVCTDGHGSRLTHDYPVIRWVGWDREKLRMTNTSCAGVVLAPLLPLDALLAAEHVRAVLGSKTRYAEGV